MPAAVAVPLIAAGIGAGGSMGAAALAGRKSSTEKAIESQQMANMKQAAAMSPQLASYGKDWMGKATSLFGPLASYYSMRMQRPDARQIRAELVPQQQSMVDQYNQALKSQTALNPRGGAGASYMGQLGFQQAGNLQNLFNQELQRRYQMQGEGAAGMGSLVGMAGNAGQGFYGQSLNALGQSTSTGNSMFSMEANRQANQTMAGMGTAQMMTQYLPQIYNWLQGQLGNKTPSPPAETGNWNWPQIPSEYKVG